MSGWLCILSMSILPMVIVNLLSINSLDLQLLIMRLSLYPVHSTVGYQYGYLTCCSGNSGVCSLVTLPFHRICQFCKSQLLLVCLYLQIEELGLLLCVVTLLLVPLPVINDDLSIYIWLVLYSYTHCSTISFARLLETLGGFGFYTGPNVFSAANHVFQIAH